MIVGVVPARPVPVARAASFSDMLQPVRDRAILIVFGLGVVLPIGAVLLFLLWWTP
jgi:hypothetical protein